MKDCARKGEGEREGGEERRGKKREEQCRNERFEDECGLSRENAIFPLPVELRVALYRGQKWQDLAFIQFIHFNESSRSSKINENRNSFKIMYVPNFLANCYYSKIPHRHGAISPIICSVVPGKSHIFLSRLLFCFSSNLSLFYQMLHWVANFDGCVLVI